jgi:peptide/nickel transport system substrate-binding protein
MKRRHASPPGAGAGNGKDSGTTGKDLAGAENSAAWLVSRRGALAGLGGLAAGAFLAACSSSSSSTGSTSAASGTASGGTSSGASGTGGTLTVGMTITDLPDLDTVYAFSVGGESMRWVGLSLYDGLTTWNLDQSTQIPTIQPNLAKSWTVNADASVYTFHLRDGVKFHDGTPWNADAAVYNINRYVDKSSPQYVAELGAIGGLYLNGVGSAQKIDDMTFSITTPGKESYGFLLQDLALLAMGSPTAIAKYGKTFSVHPVGTGPFMFSSRVSGQSITMARNPDYFRGAPKLDSLILKYIPDETARTAALRSGEVNFIESVSPSDITGLKSAGYMIVSNPYANVWRGVFDCSQAPWDKAEVRQAVNMAFDREALVTDVLDSTASAAYQACSAADTGYDPALNKQYAYNPTKAKQLLAAAGYPNGFSATFSYPTTGSGSMDGNAIAQYIQSELAKIGVNLKLDGMEFATLSAQENSGKMPGGASLAAWTATFVLPSLMNSFQSTASSNVGHYKNPKADAYFKAAESANSQPALISAITSLNTTVTDDAAWLFVATDDNPRGLAPSVRGFVDPKSWFLDIRNVWFS